jgi:hypothetical protein
MTSPEQMASEELGQYIESRSQGLCQKLVDIRPYIEEAWRRLGEGQEILGCRTKIDFSERILHREYGTIRHLMAEAGMKNVPKKDPVEITGPKVFDSFFGKTNALVPYLGDGQEHKFIQMAEKALKTPIDPPDYRTVGLIITNLREAAERFLGYASELERALRVARIVQ